MYTVEYYKAKRNQVGDYKNIKSLTIDLSDIENIVYDGNLCALKELYAKVSRMDTTGIDSITILNNNFANEMYINEILNCRWMINREDKSVKEEVVYGMLEAINRHLEYSKRDITKSTIYSSLENEKKLLEYYIMSVKSKNSEEQSNTKVLKLGKRFIKNNVNK